jgi:hypothetical protein
MIDSQRRRAVRVKKERRIPKTEDVPRIFSDQRIRELAAEAKLPLGDDLRFAALAREAALIYIGEASTPSNNEVHNEVDGLLRAADRAVKQRKGKEAAYEDVARRRERLSEPTRKLLNERSVRPTVTLEMPDPEAFRDHARRDEACETIARLCRVSACWEKGRRRPGGKRSMTMVSTLHAPELQQHPARQKAELNFVMWLRLAYLDATGEPPSLTANPKRPGPFARMVQHCLDEVHASANAGALLNELQQRRKGKKQDEALSDQEPQDIPCQVKNPKHRPR